MWALLEKMEEHATAAAPAVAESTQRSTTRRSIETLVVVLAVITIVGVLAGVLARVCGGRHLAGSADHDIEGWVESRCRSCLDGGVPPAKATPPAEEEAKK